MKLLKLLVIVTILLLVSSSIFPRTQEAVEEVEIDGAKTVVLEGDMAIGNFRITPKDMDEAVKFVIEYNPRHFDYYIDSETKRGKRYIDFSTECLRKRNIDSDENEWDITISTKYPLILELDIGACEAEFDLGGLRLLEFSLDVGATEGYIDFSERNPIRLEEISIDVGASSLEMTNIGNANFDEFTFDGGAGSFDLDFLGEYKGESIIDIDVGLGSIDIILPKGVPVQIETSRDGWFSSVDIHNRNLDEIDDGLYESDDFESSENRIILRIDIGMGAADIRWK